MQLYKNSDRSKLFSIIGLFILFDLQSGCSCSVPGYDHGSSWNRVRFSNILFGLPLYGIRDAAEK